MNLNYFEKEARLSFDFFWHEANIDPNSEGFGLIRDNTHPDFANMSSIASVGFGLAAYVIGVERSWVSYEEALFRSIGTMKTFYDHADHTDGFFYHFLEMDTAKKYGEHYDCASIIDTAIFLNGAIVASEYFGGEVKTYFEKIYARVNWQKYYDEKRNVFYMGYDEETGGFGQWDMYAEQLMQYILSAASPTYPVSEKAYQGFSRKPFTYGDFTFITSPQNALFVHQFTHAFYDFRNVYDQDGINWFDNARKASLAQWQYAQDNPKGMKTYHEHSWGWTACVGPHGYYAWGSPAYQDGNTDAQDDGTIAPTASTASIVYTPEQSINTLNYFYEKHPQLIGKYGLLDSYNLDVEPVYYADRFIGIDKGITLLMYENYRSELIWKLYMKNEYIQKASEKLAWEKV